MSSAAQTPLSDAAKPASGIVPVSVVVPCYRCAHSIKRAVESVTQQTARPLELILVDDASGDDTLRTLHALRGELGEGWVRIIALEINGGAGAARNAGWAVAQGEFVAFLDADDAWHPSKLEVQTALMRQRPDALLTGHRARQGRPDPLRPAEPLAPGFEGITLPQLLLANRFVTPSAMVRRDIPFRFRPGQRHMEDHLLWMQIAASGASILRLNATLAYTFKPAFGESGLSADLWPMEKADCGNYILLAREKSISRFAAVALCAYSGAKFVRRIILATARERFTKRH